MKKQILNLKCITLFFAILGWNNYSSAQIIGVGSGHAFYSCTDSSLVAWGYNFVGQLGDGTTTSTLGSTPVAVNTVSNAIAIAGGGFHTLFVKSDNTVWTCGSNLKGQLGDGTTTDRLSPVQVTSLSGITAVDGGGDMSLFLKNDGTVWSCGSNTAGQLGDGTTTQRTTPVLVSSLTNIIAISAGNDGGSTHSLFLKNDGTVWACGKNLNGQLGDGTTTNRLTPVQITSLSGIIAIETGHSHSLFLKNDGTVWACGRNVKGQLGDGTNTDRLTPVLVSIIDNITALAAGQEDSHYLKSDGTVWASGWNIVGQIGDGTFADKTSPVQVTSLSGITAFGSGVGHTVYIKNDGTLWANGSNGNGELGDGTTTIRSTPVQVIGLCSAPTEVNEISQELSVSVFPNPSNGQFQLNIENLQSTNAIIEIYNATGEKVFSSNVSKQEDEINLSNFSKGIYFIKVTSDKKMSQQKIIVQ